MNNSKIHPRLLSAADRIIAYTERYGMHSQPRETVARIIISLIVVSGVVVYGFAQQRTQAVALSTPSVTTSTMSSIPPAPTNPTGDHSSTPTTATPLVTTTVRFKYKDGTYSGTGQYEAPDGLDQIGVSITLVNDVVTQATVTPMARRRTTAEFQQAFIEGYSPLVIGKSINTIHLDSVSGASLTTDGFMRALSAIQRQAAA